MQERPLANVTLANVTLPNFMLAKQLNLLAINVGLFANLLLALLKTAVGIVGHSPALLADGINATSDVVYYIVVAIFVRLAHKPADHEHPYGHRQLETIAALIVGAFVITTAVAIFWNALDTMYDLWVGVGAFEGAATAALWVAFFTILLKLLLAIGTHWVGQQTDNAAVLALMVDHRNDLLAGVGTAVGIFLGRAGYLWADPLAAALVALVVLHTGITILREAAADLMDTVPSKALARQITTLLATIPAVERVEEIHAHRFGPYFVVNLTIGINGRLSVAAGDEIACRVEQTLYANIDQLHRVYVHYHPVRQPAEPPVLLCEPPVSTSLPS